MYISDTAITKPVLTVVAMLMFVVFGIVALTQLDTDEYPEIDAPVVVVAVPYPGASPDIVEREVVDPIEEAISGISGIDRMRSSSLDSYANIVVEFDFSKDPKVATQEIRDKISAIRNDLPTEMEEPILTQFDPADRPIVSLTLSSPGLTGAELTRMADPEITRRLRGIAGVASVNLVGAIERELVVEIRPRDLEATGVSVGQVVQALQSQNLAVPVGRLEGSLDERTIRLKGRLDAPTDFKQLVVSQTDGRIVRLGDLADVKDATEEPRSYAAYNDEEAVGFDILKSTGFSTTAVANEVRLKVQEIQRDLPAGVTLRVAQDGGERVDASVRGVEEALIEGAALTVAVVFLFLNSWRSTIITGLALPVSVLASFIAVWAFGFTLNTMSLMGLSLAIGILIDDAIVVRENIVRHIEMGKDHYEASREGTDEIGLAVAATTFSIVAVFVPVAFMYGISGQWFKPFALTIACSVLVSLFVSFSLDPMLSAYWPDPQTEGHERRNPIARALDRFNKWFDRMADRYKDLIAWALDHRLMMIGLATATFLAALTIPARGVLAAVVMLAGLWGAFWILAKPLPARFGMVRKAGLKLLGVTAALATMAFLLAIVPIVGQVGAGFVPMSDRSEIIMIGEAPPGSNLEYTRIKAEEAARRTRAHPEVAYTYVTVGTPVPLKTPSVDQALVYVRLVPKAERTLDQEALGQILREEMARIGGA